MPSRYLALALLAMLIAVSMLLPMDSVEARGVPSWAREGGYIVYRFEMYGSGEYQPYGRITVDCVGTMKIVIESVEEDGFRARLIGGMERCSVIAPKEYRESIAKRFLERKINTSTWVPFEGTLRAGDVLLYTDLSRIEEVFYGGKVRYLDSAVEVSARYSLGYSAGTLSIEATYLSSGWLRDLVARYDMEGLELALEYHAIESNIVEIHRPPLSIQLALGLSLAIAVLCVAVAGIATYKR